MNYQDNRGSIIPVLLIIAMIVLIVGQFWR